MSVDFGACHREWAVLGLMVATVRWKDDESCNREDWQVFASIGVKEL